MNDPVLTLVVIFVGAAVLAVAGRWLAYTLTRGRRERAAIAEAEMRETEGQRLRREREEGTLPESEGDPEADIERHRGRGMHGS